MRLFIAEKKDVGIAIAQALGKADEQNSTYIKIGTDYVTWLWGHILSLTDPEEHDERYKKWSLDVLPMTWPVTYKPIEKHKQHLNAIIDLAKKADELVNAGDPDPEGQRLVDEVLEYAGLEKKPCKRLLINDNNTSAIQKSLAKMESNANFRGLSMSALARNICDMRYGYNLTRLYTILGRQNGFDGVLSVGRVQTPILGLVVARDRENAGHKKQAFYNVFATAALGDGITGKYQPKEADPVDDKKRLNDQGAASAIVAKVKGQMATVISAETQEKQNPAPLPFNLLALQAEAAGRWKMKPKKVLEVTQTLRDKYKAITYNRSDCRYLNDERLEDAPALIDALKKLFNGIESHVDCNARHKAFDSSKVSAHHAIIPTMSVPVDQWESMTEDERRIYTLIAKSYIALFYPPEVYKATKIVFTAAECEFQASGRVNVSEGWKALYAGEKQADNDDDEENSEEDALIDLEKIKQGDTGTVTEARMKEQFTKPKPLYTMKTLLQDLASVAKYVTDPHIKKLLLDKDAGKQSESGGIGTPATRDSMIETLFSRGFVAEKGKNVVSTDLGQKFHDSLPEFATKPDMTALWHEQQKEIEAGKLDYQVLVAEVDQSIADQIAKVAKEPAPAAFKDMPVYRCPDCDKALIRRQRKDKKGYFWGCLGYPDCNQMFSDDNGKPVLEKKPVQLSEFACPECQKPLVKRKGKKGGFWGCSGFPDCRKMLFDRNGKPDFNS